MKKVIAVIVTYNRKELLKESIEALLNQNYKECQILIVDNASTDGTREYINKYVDGKKIIYENTGANLGGAGGFNYGVKSAFKMDCDFIWLMDDDCIVHKDTLEKFIEADNKLNGNYGYLSSKVLWKNGEICTMNVQRQTLTKNVKDFNMDIQEVCMASFVSLFLKREIVEEFGLPIKDFFIWTDDWEYTRRISRKHKCYLINNSVVTHKSNSNIGASIDTDSEDRLNRYNYLYRNDVYLYNREGIKGWLYLVPRLLVHILRIIKSDKKNKLKRINILIKSTFSGLKFKPVIEYPSKENVKRVLQIFGEPLSNGGQESFIMNMYRNINLENIQFDFYTPYYCDNENMKKEIENLGGKVYTSNGRFSDEHGNKKDLAKNLKKFLKNHKYEVVHIHSGSIYSLMISAKIARKLGIKNVIVHSHCGGVPNLKHTIIKLISNPFFMKYPTRFCACSKVAAQWKFPTKIINNNQYTILKNAIDTSKIYYSEEIRRNKRRELNLEDKFVVGHIGRFSPQKNHDFLIDIFKNISIKKENAILILIGIGELQDKIIEKVNELGLKEKVLFLNIRKDVNELLNAMDVLVLPSLYEGLPVVGVEAEATGLPVVASDNVTKEMPIESLSNYFSLNLKAEEWADNIIKISNNIRENTTEKIKKNGYDVKEASNVIENYYLDLF